MILNYFEDSSEQTSFDLQDNIEYDLNSNDSLNTTCSSEEFINYGSRPVFFDSLESSFDSLIGVSVDITDLENHLASSEQAEPNKSKNEMGIYFNKIFYENFEKIIRLSKRLNIFIDIFNKINLEIINLTCEEIKHIISEIVMNSHGNLFYLNLFDNFNFEEKINFIHETRLKIELLASDSQGMAFIKKLFEKMNFEEKYYFLEHLKNEDILFKIIIKTMGSKFSNYLILNACEEDIKLFYDSIRLSSDEDGIQIMETFFNKIKNDSNKLLIPKFIIEFVFNLLNDKFGCVCTLTVLEVNLFYLLFRIMKSL